MSLESEPCEAEAEGPPNKGLTEDVSPDSDNQARKSEMITNRISAYMNGTGEQRVRTSIEKMDEDEAEEGELEEGELDDITDAAHTAADELDEPAVTDQTPTALNSASEGSVGAPVGGGKTTDRSADIRRTASSSSSSSADEAGKNEKSEKKRKRREKEKRRKERKKRKREKEKSDSRKKRRRHHYDEACEESFIEPWDSGVPSLMSSQEKYDSFGGKTSPLGPYDSPPPGPYDSPPDSSDDEFTATLFSLLENDLIDPNVTASEKEALLEKHQKRLGLSSNKLKKILKRKKWFESQKVRGNGPSRMTSRDRERPKCKFYAEGKCTKGENCPFSHNFIPSKKMEACKFFLQGYCAKGDMCVYLHGEIPCKYYHTGQKCFNADKCKFSHEALSDATRPLLEKALMLDSEGDFKAPPRPSLLGSPPRHLIEEAAKMKEETKSIPSLLEMTVKPTGMLAERMEAGLFEFAKSDEEDDSEDVKVSPIHNPAMFYSDTLVTPDRPKRKASHEDDMNSEGPSIPVNVPPAQRDLLMRLNKRQAESSNLIGPSNETKSAEAVPAGLEDAWYSSDEEELNVKRPVESQPAIQPVQSARPALLPNPPGFGTPSFTQTLPNSIRPPLLSTPPSSTNNDNNAQAMANLSKILNVLMTSAHQSAARPIDPRMPDPRVQSITDPRLTQAAGDNRRLPSDMPSDRMPDRQTDRASSLADPRTNSPRLSVDTRQEVKVNHADLRSSVVDPPKVLVNHTKTLQSEPKNAISDPRTSSKNPNPLRTIAPQIMELNGIPSKPMTYRLIAIDFTKKRIYIPEGAETNVEMLKDPRVKKRLQMLKTGNLSVSSSPPSLPDITAELLKKQSELNQKTDVVMGTSKDTAGDAHPIEMSRLVSSVRGRGDEGHLLITKFPVHSPMDSARPRNTARTNLSMVHGRRDNGAYDIDDDDESELTIDLADIS